LPVGRGITAQVTRWPARVLRDVTRWFAVQVVAAQHGQSGPDIAQRDGQVDNSGLGNGQRVPVTHREDPAVGELDAVGRIVRPGRGQHGTLPGQQGPLRDPGAARRRSYRDERRPGQDQGSDGGADVGQRRPGGHLAGCGLRPDLRTRSGYYAFLEQGRDISPSSQVLDAPARALRLSPAERDHVYALAQRGDPRGGDAPETLSAGVAALVERLDPYPSFVKGRRWDILAANRAARALFTDWLALVPGQRNELLWMFTDPRARDIYVDWEKDAAAMLARFRLAAARRPDDPDFAAVIEHLHRRSAEARGWWSRHEVLFPASGTKRLRHPLLGEMTFDHVVLQVVDDPDQKLVTFSPADGIREPLTRLAATIATP
jgi:hypothetical protein